MLDEKGTYHNSNVSTANFPLFNVINTSLARGKKHQKIGGQKQILNKERRLKAKNDLPVIYREGQTNK